MMEVQQRKLQREESILWSLRNLDYLSRNQIQRLHGLGGDRNTRRVLSTLQPFVSTFRGDNGEKIFYLNKAGRERVGSEIVRHKQSQVGHYLMRNDLFIRYCPEEWKNEVKFSVEKVVTLIPDAYFRHHNMRHFLEVDHLQHMQKNREKIERYKKLKDTGVLQDRLKYFPRLVWVTLTDARRAQLLKWCDGLDVVVHLWSDIK